ncbi:MAG: tol-pal system protein YbgF [Rhodospirillales bacterium]|nr:tol-pal system protein YbgF [Rhodospirillales bacterium]
MSGGAASLPRGAGSRWWRLAVAVRPATPLAVLAAVSVLLALPPAPADAQSGVDLRPQVRELRNQIQSLRVQLAELERVVHTGAAQSGAAAETGSERGQAARNSRRLAELESDIDEAREWRRRVTGRFEEFDNVLRRLDGRIERLIADVDFRLSALEQQGGTPASSVASPGIEVPAAAPAGQVQASITPGQEAGYEPSAAPQPLGTIPAEDSGADTTSLGLSPQEQYNEAFGLLEAARYEEAHEAFSRFVDVNPTHDLAQNAAYWRAESLYARQMYPEAAKSYALNLRQYPEGRKAPDNMVKLGIALLKLGRSEEACRAFEQLDQAFSDPPLNIRRAAQQGRRQANCP